MIVDEDAVKIWSLFCLEKRRCNLAVTVLSQNLEDVLGIQRNTPCCSEERSTKT